MTPSPPSEAAILEALAGADWIKANKPDFDLTPQIKMLLDDHQVLAAAYRAEFNNNFKLSAEIESWKDRSSHHQQIAMTAESLVNSLRKSLKKAEKMVDCFLDGGCPSPEEVRELREAAK